nr:aromatic amino acid lyase [Methylomonas koyamae]
MDRQLAQLVDPKFNHGLPANLSGAQGDQAPLHHGLKALQIGVSAWTAEALKLTMPASVFSRSTECHNQDKVSMVPSPPAIASAFWNWPNKSQRHC